jgi:hypothetical protein
MRLSPVAPPFLPLAPARAGLILFDDYIYDPINMLGLWVGFAGSVWYALVDAEEKGTKAPAPLPAPAVGGGGDASANNKLIMDGAASSTVAGGAAGSLANGSGATASSLPAGAGSGGPGGEDANAAQAGDAEAGSTGVSAGAGELRERAGKMA